MNENPSPNKGSGSGSGNGAGNDSGATRQLPWLAIISALTLVALFIAWMASGPGLVKRPSRPAFVARQADDPSQQQLIAVRVASSKAQSFQSMVNLQATTAAARSVIVRSEINGPVKELALRKGVTVAQDDIIAVIDEGDRPARLREVEAQLKLRMLEFEATNRLHSQGYRAQTNLAEAQAKLEVARAERQRAIKALADTRIRAPFNGVLNERHVEIGAYLTVGDPVATIVDLDTIIVRGRVPDRERAMLREQQTASIDFLDGRVRTGAVRYVSSVAEPDTRTYVIEVELSNPQHTVVDGQTVQLSIPGTRVDAHQIPASILTVDDAGQPGVKRLDDADTVVFTPVSLISQTQTGVWVTGLPGACRLIVVGQEFVAGGEVVRAVDVGPLRARLP